MFSVGKREKNPNNLAFFGQLHPAPRRVGCPAFTGNFQHFLVNIFLIFLPMPGAGARGRKVLKIPCEAPLCPQPLAMSKPACPPAAGAGAQPLLP